MTRIKLISVILLLVALNGCGTLPAWIGTSAGTYETYKTITFTKTGVDVALAANDMPTTNNVALSKITGYDCKVSRLLDEKKLEAVCKNIKVHPPENGTDTKESEKK